jgi:CheY-like chemotaxis protein
MMGDYKRILLVDDNPNNLYVLREVIRLYYPETEILEASSGIEALTIVNIELVDIILMDIKMPDMDGFETAGLIHGRNKTSQIPIIFLSAYDHDSLTLKLNPSERKIHYLIKPIDETQLINMLKLYARLIRLKKSKCKADDTDTLLLA